MEGREISTCRCTDVAPGNGVQPARRWQHYRESVCREAPGDEGDKTKLKNK